MADLKTELLAIRDATGGVLTPAAVELAARPATHPLHSRFEWDDGVAGLLYRREQAAELIRSVRVKLKDASDGEDAVYGRFFVSIPRETGYAYDPLDEVIADPVATSVMLSQAEREWRQLYERYQHLREFVQMVKTTVSV